MTLGWALAGLTAHAKGVRLGIFEASSREEIHERRQQLGQDEQMHVRLMECDIPVVRASDELRAVEKDKPAKPTAVTKYLPSKFGDDLVAARMAMVALAESFPPAELHRRALGLYEGFRPSAPGGEQGRGAQGVLDLEVICGCSQSSGLVLANSSDSCSD